MTPEVLIFYFFASVALTVIAVMAYAGNKSQKNRNTRHVISLPIGARFTMDDSDSIWVLIHLDGCGLSVEWRGDDCPTNIPKHKKIVGDEKQLRHVVVKVVQ